MGDHSPEALRTPLCYLTTKSLGLRGRQEDRQLKWGDLVRREDHDGEIFIEFSERTTKIRQGDTNEELAFRPKMWENKENPQRCPIHLLSIFQDHRPFAMLYDESPFYLVINNKRTPASPVWYNKQAMGVNHIGMIMSKAAAKAKLLGKITTHSVRRTALTELLQSGVPPTIVAQLSGHKSIDSLSTYATASKIQQKAMYQILSGQKKTFEALPAAIQTTANQLLAALVSPCDTPCDTLCDNPCQ